MRKLLSILLVISCVMVLGACKGDTPKDEVTPTPAPIGQEQGTPDNGTSSENTPATDVDPGLNLEEDVLGDEPSVTATPTPKPDTQTTPSGQATPTPDAVTPAASSQPTLAVTPTAAPPAQTTAPVISLPMDWF